MPRVPLRDRPPVSMVHAKSEDGLVLVVGLVILVVLTLIGVTAMRSTSLEEHMAGNMQDRDQAFQLAEAALRQGENRILNGPPHIGDTGYYNAGTDPATQAPRWLQFYGVGQTPPSGGVSSLAVSCPSGHTCGSATYFIEKLHTTPFDASASITQNYDVYQVTAQGIGPDGKTVVVLQSTYRL